MSTWKKIIISGSDAILNSVTASNGYFGTASFATNSATASFFSGTVTSASYALNATSASFFSGTVTSASYALNATSASAASKLFVNVETLSGSKTILSTNPFVQILNPNAVTRTVLLPTNVPTGSCIEIWNSGIDTANNMLQVGDGVYYFYRVDPGKKITVRYTGQDVFTGPGTPWTMDGESNISIGDNHNNYGQGVGIGFAAATNHTGGVGVGKYASTNHSMGVGIGHEASNNYTNGVGVGRLATGNYTNGVGIGYGASANREQGVGIGYNSTNNFSSAVGVGTFATSNAKGVGTVAIGAHTQAERQNEFVTTGTNSTPNKAQSIIQKFRNKALATAAGAFQEIFTDASSGRLTILASSIYHFRIQVNAIEATGFKCKTWEITGAIKRNASSSTTMVGGLTATPTYSITAEDSSTTNWDVRVSANDTNEALKIEVKHDSANNVTFSATVWATETRL